VRYGTLLFADLVNSTRLANQLDPEDFRGVLSAFRRVVDDVAREHGGFINQFVGDGALVSFGYPEMREDAETSAVRAALQMVSAFQHAKGVGTFDLDLRVGIASGRAVVSAVAPDMSSSERLVIGGVAHLAARLMAEAPACGVVVSDVVRRQAGRFFEYQDLGRRTLKGFDAPVQAWLVLGGTAITSRFEAQRLEPSPTHILGRDDVMARLVSAWDQARTGAGQAVVLAGDAGIGKSRLARAICERARTEGARWVEVDCTPGADHTPLHPVIALLHRMLRTRLSDDVETRARGLATLLDRIHGAEKSRAALPILGPLVGVPAAGTLESPERVRETLIRTLVDLMTGMASQGPVVLLLEDVHWADPTTLLVVQQVCAAIASISLLVVATTRSSPSSGEFELAGSTVLNIDPLDPAAAAGVVRGTPGGTSLPDSVIARIVDRAEGNPLYLEELTRAVVDRPADESSKPEASGSSFEVPELQKGIAARLDRRPQLKPVVQAAAVLGREFPLPLLAEVLAERRPELPHAVMRLGSLGLFTVPDLAASDHVRFRHALIQESVYQTILRSERQRLHSRAADVLTQQFAGLPEAAPDAIARHLIGARRFEEAIRSLGAAAASTGRRAAYLESVGHCRAGLALLPEVADPLLRGALELELLTHLGVALSATSGYAAPEVEEVYQRARALCEEGTDPATIFPIVRGLGTFYFVRCHLTEADEVSQTCLRLARESKRTEFLIEALSFRGYTCVFRGLIVEGRAALDECLGLYRAHDGHTLQYPSPQDAGTAAWSLLPIAAWLQGDTATSESAVAEALVHADRLGRPFDLAYANVWIAMLRNMQRRYDEAEHHASICIEVSQRHGFNTWLLAATIHTCIARASRQASPETVAMLRQMHGLFIQAGAEANASFFLWGAAQGLRLTGDVPGAADAVVEGLHRTDATGERFFKSELLILGASLDSDSTRSVMRLREAFDLAEEQGAVALALRAALELLRRDGRSSGDADRDRHVQRALDGTTPYPDNRQWARTALAAARLALRPSLPA
jgi:class 3 adenylate cyclase